MTSINKTHRSATKLAVLLPLGLAAAVLCSAHRCVNFEFLLSAAGQRLHIPLTLNCIHCREGSSNARAAWSVSAAAAPGSSAHQAAVHASTIAAEQFVLDTRNIIALSVAFMVRQQALAMPNMLQPATCVERSADAAGSQP